ncbi:hypothetical protein [Sedimentitalea arenosa]|uniref:Uncharacterized protein n=1 Tax=Sedimentitalea arenosa TaxID=2798803 RepID=A0A8J7LVM8_9RHOB|nr:hypothetical protein [Arenibacterium arenosum]MBJ6371106.1 hypothetical protein [Arenibacterium arenosum]
MPEQHIRSRGIEPFETEAGVPSVAFALTGTTSTQTTAFRDHPNQVIESQMVFLNRVTVTEGVCRNAVLTSADDMVLGDEYRFPLVSPGTACAITVDGVAATIRMFEPVDVGQTTFVARRTHGMTLVSEFGHLLQAQLFAEVSGRTFVGLDNRIDTQLSYTLIDLSPVAEAG